MVTVLSAGSPAVTPSGRVAPNVSFTFSPDSTRLSSTAAKSKVFSVSPDSKVTFSGTPE